MAPVPDDETVTIYVQTLAPPPTTPVTVTVNADGSLLSNSLVPTSLTASFITASPTATAAASNKALFLDAPSNLYLSNGNYTCSDIANVKFGGGVAPFQLSMYDGLAPAPASAGDIKNHTLGTYGEYFKAQTAYLGLVGPVGLSLRYAIIDANNSFAVSPVLQIQDGTHHCSYNHASWVSRNKAALAMIIVFGFFGLIILSTFIGGIFGCLCDSFRYNNDGCCCCFGRRKFNDPYAGYYNGEGRWVYGKDPSKKGRWARLKDFLLRRKAATAAATVAGTAGTGTTGTVLGGAHSVNRNAAHEGRGTNSTFATTNQQPLVTIPMSVRKAGVERAPDS